ncbi:hypothetical protein G9A89_007344 [Geosiphon pyriformis]|nr:hypothetical protein G9A89_007344 [Geosiphon pyriformis]
MALWPVLFIFGVKRLDSRGLVPFWFDFSVHFLGGVASPSGHFLHEGVCGFFDICQSLGFGVICNDLLNVSATCLSVYTDGSLSNLGTVDMLAGTAIFFKDIDSGLGVGVFGLVSSTLVELQAIALALKCVLSFHSVDLFLDSQVALDACRSESLSVGPDFRNHCWIEHHHIANVKSHSGVLGNEWADALAKNTRFLKTGVDTVSGNLKHFVCDIFRSINRVHWEIGSGSWVLRFSLVWHPDFHMMTGFTNIRTVGFRTYFIKALYHCLLVAVQKHLYNRGYSSVVCLFCGEIEVLDHVFSCSSDVDSHAGLLDTYAAAWELLSTCILDVTVSIALCKSFVFGNWYCESVSVYKDLKVAVINVVNFIHEFCFAFHNNIWLVHVKYWAIIKKNKLIPCDDFIPVTVSGFFTWFLAGVIRLLDVANAFGISFGYHKHFLFYAGVGDMASVHISA